MATTKISSNVLASNAAQDNLNAQGSISLTKAVSLSGNLTLLGQTFGSSGTQLLPTYTFNNDISNNTGMYLFGEDTVGFTCGGSLRFRIGTTGMTSTVGMYNIGGSAASPSYTFSTDIDTGVFGLSSNVLGFSTGGTERVRIDSNGAVGINNASPSAKLHPIATTEQLRVGYDASNYASTTVSSAGAVTLNAVGLSAGFVFDKNVVANGTANRLPNQIVETSDAIITKQLALREEAFNMLNYYFPVITAGGNFGTASSASRSGSQASGWGRNWISTGNLLRTGATGSSSVPSNLPIAIAMIAAVDVLASLNGGVYRLIVGDQLSNIAPVGFGEQPALTARGWGVEIYYSTANARQEVRLFAHNGTSYVTSSGVAFPNSYQNEVSLLISHDGLGNLKLFGHATLGTGLATYPNPIPQLLTLAGAPTGSTLFYNAHRIGSVTVNHSTVAPSSGDALCVIMRTKIIIGANI